MRILFSIFTLFIGIQCLAQDFTQLDPDTLMHEVDLKNAEPTVLECADYLLSNPIDQDEINRLSAFLYLFKWMEATPEYTFSYSDEAMEFTKDSEDLITMYFVCLAKAALEESTQLSIDEMNQRATSMIIAYCGNEDNHLKPSKKLKKLMKKQQN